MQFLLSLFKYNNGLYNDFMTKNDRFDELKRYDNKVKNSNLFNYLEAQDQLGSEQIDLVNKHIYQNYEIINNRIYKLQ